MEFGLPAGYEETRRFNVHPDNLAAAVRDVLETLNGKVVAANANQFQVKFPAAILATGFTLGEKMTINIHQDGSLHANSRFAFKLQWVDNGRNREYVGQFFRQLKSASDKYPNSS